MIIIEMIVVKKVVLSVLFLLLGIIIYPSYKLIIIEKENKQIKAVINSINKDNEIIKNNNLEYQERINALKDEKKTKWEELETWQKTKQKLEKALSS